MITTRASIADHLSMVPGVRGYKERPKVLKVGDAWPLVDELTKVEGVAWQTTWRIGVVVGTDVGTATDKFDTLIPAIADALQPVVFVDSATPLRIPIEGGELYGAELIARSE
jgi:hypothetical protein